MNDLTIRLETYLNNWYRELPIEALNEIHFDDMDYKGIFGHDSRIIQDELLEVWENDLDLEYKLAHHDDLYNKYPTNITL